MSVQVRRFRVSARSLALGLVLVGLVATQSAMAANTAGWLDGSFGQGGTAALALPPWDPPGQTTSRVEAAGIIRSPTGFIAVHAADFRAEAETDDGVGYRIDALTTSGRRDPAFNGGRSKAVSFYPRVGLSPGRIFGVLPYGGGFYVVGAVNYDGGDGGTQVFSHRYAWNGEVVASYGPTRGQLGFAPPTHGSAVVLSDGSVRVCTQIAPNDALDAGVVLTGWNRFGDGIGRKYLALGEATSCNAMVADAADRLVIAGTGRIGGRRAAIVGRFDAAGTPDATFGDGGLRRLQWSTREFSAHQLVRLGSSGFALAGQSDDAAGPPLAYTARITAQGAIDTTYGYAGVYRYPGGSSGSVLRSLDAAGNNRLVAGLARVDASGTTEHLLRIIATTGRLDGSFGRNGIVGVPHRAVDTVVDGSLRTITTGNRIGSTSTVLVQRRLP